MTPKWRWFDKLGAALIALTLAPGLLAGAYYGWSRLFPASRWYVLSSVYIPDAVVGDVLIIEPDRDVRLRFLGRFITTVREVGTQTIVCSGGSEVSYSPRSTLPEPVTLAWWTAGAEPPCQAALDARGPGTYVLTTCVRIDLLVFPDREACTDSNRFTTTERQPS